MNIETAVAALRTAGYGIAPADHDHWYLYTHGPHALDEVLSSAALAAFVEHYAPQTPHPAAPPLDLPAIIVMLTAAGMAVEPLGADYWQVVVHAAPRPLANLYTAEQLRAFGTRIADIVPALIYRQYPQPLPDRRDHPVNRRLICYTLYRLGRATTEDLARLNCCDVQELAATLDRLATAGHVAAGPEATWTLAPAGWPRITAMIPPEGQLPGAQELPDPRLARVVARLIHDLEPFQFTRLDLTYPGLSGAAGCSALLTATPEPRGIAWSRNLAATAVAAGVPAVSFALELLEAERAQRAALSTLLPQLRARAVPTPIGYWLVAAEEGLVAVVRAAARQWLPAGPWAISAVAGALAGQWGTYPAARLALDLMLTLRQPRS